MTCPIDMAQRQYAHEQGQLDIASELEESERAYSTPKESAMSSDKAWSLIALLLTFAVIALVGKMDAEDDESVNRKYCEMVALWDADAASAAHNNSPILYDN